MQKNKTNQQRSRKSGGSSSFVDAGQPRRFTKERDTPARHHTPHFELSERHLTDGVDELLFLVGRDEVFSILKA